MGNQPYFNRKSTLNQNKKHSWSREKCCPLVATFVSATEKPLLLDTSATCYVGDLGSIPGLGRSPEEGDSYPLQYSGLENSKD